MRDEFKTKVEAAIQRLGYQYNSNGRTLRTGSTNTVAFMRIGSILTNEPSKRKNGFVSACVELGLPFEVMALNDNQPFSEFETFLRSHMNGNSFDFDGLFIGTDSLAWEIIRLLRGMNLRVPEDVQVIGFDGIRMFGDQEPIVSSIVQPVQEIAEACVNTLLSEQQSSVPSLICLPITYCPGGTTKE